MTKITILGSCRQYSIANLYPTTNIQDSISFPHYSKEVLEVIRLCKYGNSYIPVQDTSYIFRTPILNNSVIVWSPELYNNFMSSDLFVIEIASKICYKINGHYAHHIAVEPEHNRYIRHKIQNLPIEIYKQTKDEIEQDIIQIKNELFPKKVLIISHICTYESGDRYILTQWLEEICKRHNIPFLNPMTEFKKRNENIDNLFVKEKVLSHYTKYGETVIQNIYHDVIYNLLNGTSNM